MKGITVDEKTLTALRGSIAKWEAIVAGTGVDNGITDCPLCTLFYPAKRENDGEPCSRECPVVAVTNRSFCISSPYEAWLKHHYLLGHHWDDKKIRCEECIRLANEELSFLKSLLPKDDERTLS